MQVYLDVNKFETATCKKINYVNSNKTYDLGRCNCSLSKL